MHRKIVITMLQRIQCSRIIHSRREKRPQNFDFAAHQIPSNIENYGSKQLAASRIYWCKDFVTSPHKISQYSENLYSYHTPCSKCRINDIDSGSWCSDVTEYLTPPLLWTVFSYSELVGRVLNHIVVVLVRLCVFIEKTIKKNSQLGSIFSTIHGR